VREAAVDLETLARLVQQRRELGAGDWVLESLTRKDALALIRAARDPDAPAPRRKEDPEGAMGEGEAVAASARAPDGEPAELPRDYAALREIALACTRCRLAEGRTQVVFSDGNPEGRLMVVGEAPGANEDRTGLPFVGAAGKLLDLLLASIGLSREQSVYICNVIKCRPPGNRNPRPDEIESCAPYLRRQIELVRPEAILGVGTFAAQLLAGKDIPLGRLRGEVYSYQGTPLVVTYHPAALLRNSNWTRATWDDLQLLRRVLDDG
jgi:uracil-DNA glycosylase